MSKNDQKQPNTEHKKPRKLGPAFSLATLGLGAITAKAAFEGSTGIAVTTGAATGAMGVYTAWRLFAEGMSA